jgi:hypothetical protein
VQLWLAKIVPSRWTHACYAIVQSWLNSQLELRDSKGILLDADFTPLGKYTNGGTMQARRLISSAWLQHTAARQAEALDDMSCTVLCKMTLD